jgi:hypothetical protein
MVTIQQYCYLDGGHVDNRIELLTAKDLIEIPI